MKPLQLASKLASTPQNTPKYFQTVKDGTGKEIKCADPRASRALVALMDLHAVNGGAACHWGGAAAFAEINSALHSILFADKSSNWHESFNYINDPGHCENGVYAVRAQWGYDNMSFETLRGFRSIESKLTGHGESHLNPEGVLMSNGPLGSSLPQAQGLAIADKIIGNDRVTFCLLSDGASMEGEARESFAAIPGLAAKNRLNPFVLVISDNNTKLSGRISDDSFSMEPTFNAMPALGWETVIVQDGHDLQAVYSALEDAINKAKNNSGKPVCLICKTIKGKGVKSTEEHAAGGHGFPLKAYDEKISAFIDEIWRDETPEEFKSWAKELTNKPESKKADGGVKTEKVQMGISRGLIRAAKDGLPIYSVCCDVQGSTGMGGFIKEFPDRYLEVGIAESNMVSTGAGLSKAGFIPVVDAFCAFAITKGNLPLIMASLSQAPIIGVFSHTGFQDAADGASHQATTYFAAVSSIPNVDVICVATSGEAEALIYEAANRIAKDRQSGKDGRSVVFFLGRENFPQHFEGNSNYQYGKAQVLREGSDITLVSCGPLLPKALKAADDLAAKGVKATVINNSSINFPDTKTIGEAVVKTGGKMITVEDHQIIGGMGAQLIHALNLAGYSDLKVKSLGIDGIFGQSAYIADILYERYGLDEKGIAKSSF